MKWLLLLLSLPAFAANHVPAYVNAPDGCRCGMYLRDPQQVQVWCWHGLIYTADTAISNTILNYKGRTQAMVLSFHRTGAFVVKFTFDGDKVTYEAIGDGDIVTGELK